MSKNIYQWSESGKKIISMVRKSNELNIRGKKVEPIRYQLFGSNQGRYALRHKKIILRMSMIIE